MSGRAVRLAPKARTAVACESLPSTERAQFNSHMVMVRHLAEISDAVEGEHIHRRLLETVAFLERRHGLKSSK